jgi:hypothetical protein
MFLNGTTAESLQIHCALYFVVMKIIFLIFLALFKNISTCLRIRSALYVLHCDEDTGTCTQYPDLPMLVSVIRKRNVNTEVYAMYIGQIIDVKYSLYES